MSKPEFIFLNRHRIREACDIRNISITQLAAVLYTSPPNFYKMMANGFPPDRAESVADYLHFSVADLSARLSD